MYSDELKQKVEYWRARALEGTITREELTEAIAYLRQGRSAALRAPGKGKPAPEADLFEGLD